MSQYSDKIARILRIDRSILADLEKNLDAKTGKSGVMQKICEENEYIIAQKLERFRLNRKSYARTVYDVLLEKVKEDDTGLNDYIGLKNAVGVDAAKRIADFVVKAMPPQKGWFLKKEKAREFLVAIPPQKIMESLGYKTAEEMVAKEDLLEVFSALRFLEDAEWLNSVFFKQYEKLTPDDFEERVIEVKPLGEKWAEAARKFTQKKHHTVSHLKELGVIFIIPIFNDRAGETLRLLSLTMHYLNEVKYYSNLFEQFKPFPKFFAFNLISLLRGDVAENRALMSPASVTGARFLVVQRYLAKGDENDWRLFVPHVNPEAFHWQKAEDGIQNIPAVFPDFKNDLSFWKGLGWVGDYFDTETGIDQLVSFNLVDTIMNLADREMSVKYLYHHQESLWNKIFASYYGEDKMLEQTKENIVKGWFEV